MTSNKNHALHDKIIKHSCHIPFQFQVLGTANTSTMNNTFLLPHPVMAGREHDRECFCCVECRVISANKESAENSDLEIFNEYFQVSHRQVDEQLNVLFLKTKRKILLGYTVGKKCLLNTIYTSFGAWLSAHPQHGLMPLKERRDMATKVRHATKVFEDWDRIVHNLTNPAYRYIDARRFSVDQLYRSRNDFWVYKQNKLLGPKERDQTSVPNYSQEKIQTILTFIAGTQIIDDVSGADDQLQLISKDLLDGMKKLRDSPETN